MAVIIPGPDQKVLLSFCATAKTLIPELHIAALLGKEEAVGALVEGLGVEAIDLKGPGGNTALHFAALGGHQAMMDILTKYGASEEITNRDGGTPEHIFRLTQKKITYLAEGYACVETPHVDALTLLTSWCFFMPNP